MRHLIILFCLFTTTLPAQFSVYLEQGIGISDEVHYQPIGLGVDYQVTKKEGFNLIVGLAYNQTTLEEELTLNPVFDFCGVAGCFDPPNLFIKSYESRIILPFGISHASNRFTYGLQVRPGYRFGSSIRTLNPSDRQPIEGKFGEDLPFSRLISDQSKYRVDKSKFSLQLGTDFRYALTESLSFGLNYRYEGALNDEIILYRSMVFSSTPTREIEYLRGETRAHYLVATAGWRF